MQFNRGAMKGSKSGLRVLHAFQIEKFALAVLISVVYSLTVVGLCWSPVCRRESIIAQNNLDTRRERWEFGRRLHPRKTKRWL